MPAIRIAITSSHSHRLRCDFRYKVALLRRALKFDLSPTAMASGLSSNASRKLRFKLFWTGSNAGFAFLMFTSLVIFNNALAVGRSDAFADRALANPASNSSRSSESIFCALPVFLLSGSFVWINYLKIAAMA